MKKLFLFALISTFVFSACGKKAEEPAANDAKAEAAAGEEAKADEAKAEDAKADEAKADENADPFAGMDKKKYDDTVKKMTNDERIAFETKALKHADPNIRKLPMMGMTYNLESVKSDRDAALLSILQNETDVDVLETALRSNMNNLKVSNDFFEAYKKAATHEDVKIRKAAMNGLINSNNHSVEGIEEAGIKYLDDADADVRARACKELGRNKYEAAMPKIEELLKTSDDAKILQGCVEGIEDLWYYDPFFKEFDAKAYQLTLNYLKKTPRGKDMPHWGTLSRFQKAPKDEWKELAKKDFKAKDLVAALSDIAKDDNADKMTREYAVKALAVQGTKADLTKL
ncbi:MAG: HEAT repeat domain-containing protein, partial [Proteobacteria bacterium]|nr:HEAT repeat domain-containing protein [Pseudomonadota bacterium]